MAACLLLIVALAMTNAASHGPRTRAKREADEVMELAKSLGDATSALASPASRISGAKKQSNDVHSLVRGLESLLRTQHDVISRQFGGREISPSGSINDDTSSQHHHRTRRSGHKSRFIVRIQRIADKHLKRLQSDVESVEGERRRLAGEYDRVVAAIDARRGELEDEIRDLKAYIPRENSSDSDSTDTSSNE